eukprot:TRINITY_DN7096_c0_g1_i1.p1 TRINITY_DN7096_c0_g1~~TRINITY_DN7096_c0_g1_i1.p1  ORF type:complete len:190 (-),score=30.67 TRINITY_DN7096_c0_g1_i1:64-633(-)
MFSLMCGLWQYAMSKPEHKVLILGVDGAGKTTILERMKNLFLGLDMLPKEKIFPTVGLNLATVDVPKAKLIFRDLGGEKSLRSIWEKYYGDVNAIVFVVDASNPERLPEAETVFESLTSTPQLSQLPFLVLLNKQDLGPSISTSELEPSFSKYTKTRRFRALGCSGATGDGIREAVNWLVAVVDTPLNV